MAIVCGECGVAVEQGATFCPACLASIAPASAHVAAPSTPSQVSQPAAFMAQADGGQGAQSRTLLWVLIGLLSLGLLAAIGFMLRPSGDGSDGSDSASPPVAEAGSGGAQADAVQGEAVGPEVAKYLISDANIRNVPTAKGPDSQVVGSVKRGVQVKGAMHKSANGSDYWFKLADGRGFISAVNLSDAPPVAGAAPAAAAAGAPAASAGGKRAPMAGAPFCQVATSSGNLRIRSGPNGPIVGGMPKGAQFQAYGSQSDAAGVLWFQVRPIETRYPAGWVSGDYIIC